MSNDHGIDKVRGNQSFIFRFGNGESAEIIFVDRDEKIVNKFLNLII